MSEFLVDGAELSCPLGSSSGCLKVPNPKVKGNSSQKGNQFDCIPMVNITPFGTCSVTTCPCIPATAPWMTSSNVKTRFAPALNKESKTMCALGGMITVSDAGQSKVNNKGANAPSPKTAPPPTSIESYTTQASGNKGNQDNGSDGGDSSGGGDGGSGGDEPPNDSPDTTQKSNLKKGKLGSKTVTNQTVLKSRQARNIEAIVGTRHPPYPPEPNGKIVNGYLVTKVNGRYPINCKYAGQANVKESGVGFTRSGYPDFSKHAEKEVQIENLTGNRDKDAKLANKMLGYPSTPEGYTWHHVEDGVTMQLVPTDLHEPMRHTGGAAALEQHARSI